MKAEQSVTTLAALELRHVERLLGQPPTTEDAPVLPGIDLFGVDRD